ncbi:efflux RND transporter permease subunit [Fulvivirga maritima]|uniref:efflux RND transporter permease subunit n=1 Tax=Fulvivirga maritima TaxID=2904247 RepID=UPI001F2BB28C|nr:efflux RND transporter permease subunit [Fulvivirga maritima]UII29426.1 efflux RND transporter permease subunit [Fulvivirga maritima]
MSDINTNKNNQPINGDTNSEKEFGLTKLSLNNRNTVFFLLFLVVIMGISAYINLPKDSYPEVEQPMVYVGTTYLGNSPVDIENLITRPLEKEINDISEIDNIKSTSVQDYSTIIVEFEPDMDIDDALQKVKDAVDKAKQELPNDLDTDPNVFEMDFSEMPIMNINLSGNFRVEKLEDVAEDLEDELEKISEVSSVEIRGVDDKEVKIMANPYLMDARQVSFSDITQAVQAENVTFSAGNIKEGDVRRTIRVVGEYEDPKDMLDIVVKHENGNIVYLGDVAKIEFDYVDPESYARLALKPVVSVDVIKGSGENLLIATDKINEVLEEMRPQFPEGLEITITNDQSQMTRDLVNSLENNIISGVILVVLVLLFFLGTRNALFVGVAIPVSMFITFLIMSALGITINMMVLFSLILALGMLVDNGIVIVENVYRLMEEGLSPWEATKLGVSEVAWPIITSTATTLAAFLPLAMWPGLMGQFMRYLPIGVMITLSSSLFVALVINPVLISVFMKIEDGKKQDHTKVLRNTGIFVLLGTIFLVLGATWLGNLLVFIGLLILLNVYVLMPASRKFQSGFLPWLENIYSNTLAFALKGYRPWLFFWGTIFLLILSVVLNMVSPPKVLFFPENLPKYVNVFIEFPIGTDIEKTNSFSKQIEEKVLKVVNPYGDVVESVIAKVGQDTGDPNDPSSFGSTDTPNKSRITVNFVEFKDRHGVDTREIMDSIRHAVDGYPGVSISVDKDAAGPPVGKPINIEVSGDDIATLIAITDRMKNFINESGIKGIENLQTDLETGKPELLVNIDRDNARRFGLSTRTIANEIRTALFGMEISKFKQGEDDYEIQLRLQDEYRYDLEALKNREVTFRDQKGQLVQIPISSVAEMKLSTTYGSVKRKDLERVVTLYSNVLQGYNATAINAEIQELLQDFEMPAGYDFKFGGEQEKQAEEMAFLTQALWLAVFIIFLIIVAQFNKITTPVIIMSSVVLSTVGVFLGLFVFRMDFVVIMTMIGIISLAGVVVNNAIVLIDFIELIRARKQAALGVDKLDFEDINAAIAEAGRTRLRPVLLTAITTILGLIPLALGINFDFVRFFNDYNPDFYMGGDNVIFWGPMSWTIIFGLTFATFLTLVIVPIMYQFFAKINRKFGVN